MNNYINNYKYNINNYKYNLMKHKNNCNFKYKPIKH